MSTKKVNGKKVSADELWSADDNADAIRFYSSHPEIAQALERGDILATPLSGVADQNKASQIMSPFDTIRIGDIADTGPPQFMVDTLWLESGVGIVGGHPKSWKSFFTLFVAIHVAAGLPVFGKLAVKRGRVVLFNAEDTAPLTRYRTACMCRALGINISDLDFHVIATPSLFIDDHNHVEQLRRTIELLKPSLLILDPLRNLHGLDENDSAIVPLVLTPLRLIQREFGCAVQVVHHLVKDTEGKHAAASLRGTGAIRGWYDSAWILNRSNPTSPVKVTVEHRGAQAPEPFMFTLKTSETPDGVALRFDTTGTAPADDGSTLEEQLIALRDSNPRVRYEDAREHLKQLGFKFGNDIFSAAWKASR